MKFLGIDYGSKRIGLALSDPAAALAFPFEVIPANKKAVAHVAKVCKDYAVDGVVIGDSKDFKNKDNIIMKAARLFAELIKSETGLPVAFEPEMMSSIQAQRLQGRADLQKKTIDASAAAVILQSFLDRHMMGQGVEMDDDN